MIKINKRQALSLLLAAVKEQGKDFVYRETFCRYVVDEQPSCLVGDALHRAGVSIEVLREMNSCGPLALAKLILENHDVHLTTGAAHAFCAAQHAQDGRKSWGEALKAAKES